MVKARTQAELKGFSRIRRPTEMRTWANDYSAPTLWPFLSHCGIYTLSGIIPPRKTKQTPRGISELFRSRNQFTAEVCQTRRGNRQCIIVQRTQIWGYIIWPFVCSTACSPECHAPSKPLSVRAVPAQCGEENTIRPLSSLECMQSSRYSMHELLLFPACWLKGRWSGIKMLIRSD